eukprot:4473938-Pleurochrysis_carterae.AAC.1
MGALAAATCTHGEDGHAQVAHGRDAQGKARAAAAAAYPPPMNVALAKALLAATGGSADNDGDEAPGGTAHGAAEEIVEGGRITDGPRLSKYVRVRMDAARTAPPRFASLRNMAPDRRRS